MDHQATVLDSAELHASGFQVLALLGLRACTEDAECGPVPTRVIFTPKIVWIESVYADVEVELGVVIHQGVHRKDVDHAAIAALRAVHLEGAHEKRERDRGAPR